MTRVLVLAFTLAAPAGGYAQEKRPTDPKPPEKKDADPAGTLAKAKEEFRAAVEKARAALVAALDAEAKKVVANAKLAAADRVARAEELAAEKAAFEADGELPRVAAVRPAVAEYRTATATARTRCEKAFEAAAEALLAAGDVAGAKAVVAEKEPFLDGFNLPAGNPVVREYWVYAGTKREHWFRAQKKGEWAERSGDNGGQTNRFREVRRTVDYVELYDANREVGARLYADKVEMRLKGTGWEFLAKGGWEKPK